MLYMSLWCEMLSFLRKYFFIYIFCMYQFVYGHFCFTQYYKYLRMDVKQYWRVIIPVESYTPAGRPSFAPCIHWQQPWQKSAFAPIPLQNKKNKQTLSAYVFESFSTQSYRVISVLWLFHASLHIVTTNLVIYGRWCHSCI